VNSATIINLASATLLLASIYCLVNVGLVTLYRSTGLLNFAQGQFVMLGAYVMVTVTSKVGYWPGLLLSAVVLAFVSWLSYHLLMRFLLGADDFQKVVLSFMLAVIVTQVVVITWGTDSRNLEPPTAAQLHVGGGVIPVYDLIAAGLAVTVVVVLMAFISRTITGLRMRALAMNETLAVYNGIRVHRLAGIAWAIAGAGAAIAGVIYAQSTSVTLSLADVGLIAFPAAVLGGLDSIGGSILGSVIVAGVLTVTGYNYGGYWSDVTEYALLLAVLVIRPYGLFGRRVARRI
jgi:branched-chain amino acid transport system permease protein